jgi:hypothetical protein
MRRQSGERLLLLDNVIARQETRTVSECLPCLAHSSLILNVPYSAVLFFSGFLCCILFTMSRFYRIPALLRLFGFNSFQVVKDLPTGIYCHILLFSVFDHLLYFLYP